MKKVLLVIMVLVLMVVAGCGDSTFEKQIDDLGIKYRIEAKDVSKFDFYVVSYDIEDGILTLEGYYLWTLKGEFVYGDEGMIINGNYVIYQIRDDG